MPKLPPITTPRPPSVASAKLHAAHTGAAKEVRTNLAARAAQQAAAPAAERANQHAIVNRRLGK